MKRPTINDVAARAGVSRSTASRAMSDYGRIAPVTIERVKQAAMELGYQPNAVAQSMRAGSTKTIGLVVIADFTNVFFDRATKGIVDAARAHGYEVIISNTDENISIEREAINTLLQKQVDGLIVVPSTAAHHDHLSPASRQNKPLVIIDRMVSGVNATSITTNDFESCEAAVKEAVSKGHKNLAFLIATATIEGFDSKQPMLRNTTIEDRVDGFMHGVTQAKNKNSQWVYCSENPEVAEAAVNAMLDSKTPPSIIFTSNNDMALAVLKVAGKRGLVLGKDISLVTVDDSQWLEAISPGITVVERPVDEVARLAVEKLLEHINNKAKKPEKIVLPTRLISRGSVATLKAK